MINTLDTIPNVATTGSHLTLKGRGRSGSLMRINQTAPQTSTNASNVPIFTNSAITLIGVKAETNATTSPVRIEAL